MKKRSVISEFVVVNMDHEGMDRSESTEVKFIVIVIVIQYTWSGIAKSYILKFSVDISRKWRRRRRRRRQSCMII